MHRISPQIFRRTPSEPYNQMQMELISNTHIPDGLLASMTLLSEKPRQGVPSRESALHPGIDERNCTAVLGLQFGWSGIVSGTVDAPSNGQVPVHGPWTYGNHCGAGGMGTPINGTDAACQTHDACYNQAGFSPGSNFQGGNAQLQACNQQLCNAVRGARQSIINQAGAAGSRTSRGVSPVYSPGQWSELQADSDINLYFTYIVPGANSCH
jgi:hypothetical protein